jgi:transcription elongation factor Elf1
MKSLAKPMSTSCEACTKSFDNTRLLNNHLSKTILCREWIKILKLPDNKKGLDESIIHRIQKVYSEPKKLDPTQSNCLSCHKSFSNKTNLNKHINRTLICQKWGEYHKLQTRSDYSEVTAYNNSDDNSDRNMDIVDAEAVANSCNAYWVKNKTDYWENNSLFVNYYFKESDKFDLFIKLDPIPMYHIIWNLFLTDKESKIDDYSKYDIELVICIMPQVGYGEYNPDKDQMFVNLEYSDHSMVLTDSEIKGYDLMCDKLLNLQKTRKNALIVCNNGYQRSLPFICYYLTKYHKDEVPTIDKALDIILSQVDKANYPDNKIKSLEGISSLPFLTTN